MRAMARCRCARPACPPTARLSPYRIVAGLLLAATGAAQASDPIGCLLPDWCGIDGQPACQIDCAPLGEFQWMRYCPGHLSDGYVSHQAFGGHHAYRLRVEANGDMTFITSSDQGFYEGAESPTCGDWGLHIR